MMKREYCTQDSLQTRFRHSNPGGSGNEWGRDVRPRAKAPKLIRMNGPT